MKNASDKRSSKFLLLALVIIVIYLAFFSFDVDAAYEYTIVQARVMLQAMGF